MGKLLGVGMRVGLAVFVLVLALGQTGCQGQTKIGAGTDGDTGRIVFQTPAYRDLDLLFLIDDSVATRVQQAKFRAQIPAFVNVLSGLPGGPPNLHVAVVSSSLGAGVFTNVNGCMPGTIGDLGGAFQHSLTCAALPPTEHFIKSIEGQNNFAGSIADVVSCIANIGSDGCGFEHQFQATRLALQRAQDPNDPDNAGFLRPKAVLAIVMLTNEDDCSVDADSMLLDPSQETLADPLGPYTSYRCNLFGHKCDQPLPRDVTGLPMALTGCRSAEDGRLVTVDGFVQFLRGLKENPTEQIIVAAFAGPTAPYTVGEHSFTLGTGAQESQPWIEHSCTQALGAGVAPDYGDPAIRIKQWLDAFGGNGVLQSVCAPDFRDSMTRSAQVIGTALVGANCVSGKVALNSDGTPDCRVVETSRDGAGMPADVTLPFCSDGRPVVPCWEFAAFSTCSSGQQRFQICGDTGCTPVGAPTDTRSVELFCRFAP